jgi:hypothetical protein
MSGIWLRHARVNSNFFIDLGFYGVESAGALMPSVMEIPVVSMCE